MTDSLKSFGGLPSAGAAFDLTRFQQQQAALEKMQNLAHPKEMPLKGVNKAEDKEAEKAATQFEALLLHQMMNEMWKAVPSSGLLSGSREEEMYRDMLNQAVATNIAEHKSIGVKDVVLKELKAKEKK